MIEQKMGLAKALLAAVNIRWSNKNTKQLSKQALEDLAPTVLWIQQIAVT